MPAAARGTSLSNELYPRLRETRGARDPSTFAFRFAQQSGYRNLCKQGRNPERNKGPHM